MMFRKASDWFFKPDPPPKKRYTYVAPDDALDVGPVIDDWPAYIRIWRDKEMRRVKLELRSAPGVIVAIDERVLGSLIDALVELKSRIAYDS